MRENYPTRARETTTRITELAGGRSSRRPNLPNAGPAVLEAVRAHVVAAKVHRHVRLSGLGALPGGRGREPQASIDATLAGAAAGAEVGPRVGEIGKLPPGAAVLAARFVYP